MSLDRTEGVPVLWVRNGQLARPANDQASDGIRTSACEAAAFLKALSHEGRLMIMVHLAERERSVTELETLLGARQAAVSQQLARLRLEGLVSTRRDGKTIFYAIRNSKVLRQVRLMEELFSVA
jgi:DNA-binding transcriptional ArsR family regulator